ncbi:MAG: tagatose-6-phosphate ketose isomerase [Acidobacteriota bacterium]
MPERWRYVPVLDELLSLDFEQQCARGYGRTLREILQQPGLWRIVSQELALRRGELKALLSGGDASTVESIVLTGSGSSLYVSECLAPGLQARLGISTRAVASGAVLLDPAASMPPGPSLMVSFARSGRSPESWAALDAVLDGFPDCRHLIITCDAQGKLATRYADHSRVATVVLDRRTCDQSLVMTSSFTSMAVAGLSLGMLDEPDRYRKSAAGLAAVAEGVLANHTPGLAELARRPFGSAVFLGSGASFGAAKEAGLKMLEMTAGRVHTLSETFLGLRHGPLAAIQEDTLVVGFLASDDATRHYELDLLRELVAKRPAGPRLFVGENISGEISRPGAVCLECPGLGALDDDGVAVLHVVVGQLLAFFRCLEEGLCPDSPSPDGVISRVVKPFEIHGRP